MIFRVTKDKNNPYVIVNKTFINDASLSWKAKGILLYLLSKPDHWQVYEKDIVNHGKDGRDAVRSALRELIKEGYITRVRNRDEKGRLTTSEYVVSEVSAKDGKSNIGKSNIGKSNTTNNNNILSNDSNEYNNDNGVFPKSENSARNFTNINVMKAIKEYMNNLYMQKTGKKHPFIKSEQFKKVYNTLCSYCEEWGLEYDSLIDMMCQFLNSNISSDWNINHFATEGILTCRMYEVAY